MVPPLAQEHAQVLLLSNTKGAMAHMPPTYVTTTDIFAPPAVNTVIGHGVNTRGLMGAGFAALIARRFPDVKRVYVQACNDGNLMAGMAQVVPVDAVLSVANIASQVNPGADATVENLRAGMNDLYRQAALVNVPVHVRLPLIGAGIGGIDPIVAAHTILAAAVKAPSNVETSLHLLPSDAHTDAVMAYYHAWVKGQE